MTGPVRDVPTCTIFLALGALAAHTLVLVGNLSTASMLNDLGSSTAGWSSVGLGIATAMQRELVPAMSNVSYYLTETIEVVTDLQQSTDIVLAASGTATDAALAKYNGTSRQQFKDQVMAQLRTLSSSLLNQTQPLVDKLLVLLRPVTAQLQAWLKSFGAKVQPGIEEFAGTLDKAQKLFDQVVSQFGGPVGTNAETMVYNTYTLFDADNSGTIYPTDLRQVAIMFGISALSGNKAQELFVHYDTDSKGGIDAGEFARFVNDPSIPEIMPVVLRRYSKVLAAAGGALVDAQRRDEVAAAVVKYLQVVSSKNLTRLSWVSQALTNGSLPIQFTADIMRELAAAVDDPGLLTVIDVGAAALGEMARLNPEYAVKALKLLSEPAFWAAEGFPGEQQPAIIARLVNWTAAAPRGVAALKQAGLDFRATDGSEEDLGDAAYTAVQGRQDKFAGTHLLNKSHNEVSVYSSSASRYLRAQLLGGSGAAAAGDNPEADNALQAGAPAAPETLRFAAWLASNATLVARQHLEECFVYSGKSSGTLDNTAREISGMFSKVQSFLDTMATYATPEGAVRLVNKSLDFVRDAADDIVLVGEEYVDAQLAEIDCQLAGGGEACSNLTARQRDMSLDLSGAFTFVTDTLSDLKTVLPTVVKDLKFAKSGVSSVAHTMDGAMTLLGLKAPPLMYQIGSLYKVLWVVYFIFFTMVSAGVLFYGFWASGWFGGPQGEQPSEEAPRSFATRLGACWRSCTACCRGCHDSSICFWSCMLLAEVVVLLLYLVCVLICVVAGVQIFFHSGCAEVFILGDMDVCTSALSVVNVFLQTFWQKPYPLDEACSQETLLTCSLISNQVMTSGITAIVGGVLAASLSFWMVIESAVLHERARVRQFVGEKAKRF